MTTIRILAERIMRLIKGGNVSRDNQWDERDIQYLVRDVSSELIKGTWFEERNEGGKGIDSRFVVTFEGVEIKEHESTGENYIEMPIDSYLRLLDDSGVRSIRPDFSESETKKTKEFERKAFIPIPNRFRDIYSNLPAGALEQQVGFEIRKDRVYFTKIGDQTVMNAGLKKVIIDVATVDPAAVDIDDALPLPNEYVPRLIGRVFELLGINATPDVINDNNPIVTQAK